MDVFAAGRDKKKKILIGDESITIQKLVNLTFAGQNFEVINSMDGHDVSIKLKRLKPDLVILDAALREMSGIDLAEKIRLDNNHIGTKVVIMRGNLTQTQADRLAKTSVDGVIDKPFDSKTLLNMASKLLYEEESTVKVLSEQASEEETTQKVPEAPQADLGPFRSFRKKESESSKPPGRDLFSKLEKIANEVAAEPSGSNLSAGKPSAGKPGAHEEEEDTLDVPPKNFYHPVNTAEAAPHTDHHTQTHEMPTLSNEDMRAIIREEVQFWIRENLPAMAERLLKEEISKLAQNQ